MKSPCGIRFAAHAAVIVSFSLGLPATGSAHSDGQTMASGKQSGFYCNSCHAGGTVPTVAFGGPTTVEPGSSATFSFTVTTHSASQIGAGLDVASSAGPLGSVAGQGTQLLFGEVTHTMPKENDANGQATFEFTWQAPTSAAIYTLYGAGCSVNLNDSSSGDAAARTTYAVYVGIATPTPTNTPQPPTPTPTPTVKPCVGDCETPGEVTTGDLITGVSIALGFTPSSACPAFEPSGDGEVTVVEVQQAVNSMLNGCTA